MGEPQTESTHVELALRLPVTVRPRGQRYQATCSSLDLSAEGSTPGNARQRIEDAIRVMLESNFGCGAKVRRD